MFKSVELYKSAFVYFDTPLVYTQAFTNRLLGVETFAQSYAEAVCGYFFKHENKRITAYKNYIIARSNFEQYPADKSYFPKFEKARTDYEAILSASRISDLDEYYIMLMMSATDAETYLENKKKSVSSSAVAIINYMHMSFQDALKVITIINKTNGYGSG